MVNNYEVRLINTIDYKNIKLGKTFKYGDNYNLTNIYYMNNTDKQNNISNEKEGQKQDAVDEKTKFIIQTPMMYMPNSVINLHERPFLELSFNNENNDKDVAGLREWITELEEHIYKLIKRRTKLGIKKENLISILKSGYAGTSTKLLVPINMNISKCLLIDETKRNKFLFNWEIPVPTYGISILWIKNVWVKKEKWGINLFMYASKIINSHILDPIDFMGNSHDNKSIRTTEVINTFKKNEKMNITISNVPEYNIYFKMLKMGIPKDAIKQKMLINSIDCRIIDYPENTPYITVLHYISNPHLGPYINNNSQIFNNMHPSQSFPPPPPPLPPLPPPLQLQPLSSNQQQSLINTAHRNLLNEISTGDFKLKKVEKIEKVEKVEKEDPIINKLNSMNIIQKGFKVPSLSDIKNALSKLRKVEPNIDPEEK